jgi:hypothetical protein
MCDPQARIANRALQVCLRRVFHRSIVSLGLQVQNLLRKIEALPEWTHLDAAPRVSGSNC